MLMASDSLLVVSLKARPVPGGNLNLPMLMASDSLLGVSSRAWPIQDVSLQLAGRPGRRG